MSRVMQIKKCYRLIRRGDAEIESFPLACPLCECVLMDEIDEISMVRTGCCFDCESEVVDPNREKWKSGWRPPTDEMEEIKVRRLASPHSRRHI